MAGGSIELSGLTKRFSEIAVDNIDLTVASGEFFSLLGPSGCGKTTTLRLIAGFEQPTSGTDPARRRRRVRRAAAPAQRQHGVPELRAVPVPDVWDNVAFGLRHRGWARRISSAGWTRLSSWSR